MRKALIVGTLAIVAAVATLPKAASAETLTTGVTNTVSNSIFCGSMTAKSATDYRANGTFSTSSFADKTVKNGFEMAGATDAKSKSEGDTKVNYNQGDGNGVDIKSNSNSESKSEGATVGANGTVEHSGSKSASAGTFQQHDVASTLQQGSLRSFSASLTTSSFTSSGL